MSKMKDSGIEWIGLIPENWEVKKVKHAFNRKQEKAEQEEPVVLSLARSGVKIRDITTGEGQIAESYFNYNPVEVGDFLLNPMDLYSGANCSVSNVEGVISPAYINLRAREGYNSTYYDYYFKTQYWAMVLFAHGKGVSFDNRWTLNAETLFNYFIPVPDISIQNEIADFLNKKVAEIDKSITDTKATIEDYKKYKQAVITEAVTKGLDDTVVMKESGIEWIGKIPIDWNVVKAKYISIEIGDGLHSTPEYDDSGDVFFVNGNNIGAEYLTMKENTNKLNDNELLKYKKPTLNENTVLIALNGATYGKTSFYSGEKVLLGKSAGYITLDGSVLRPFFRYYLQSHYVALYYAQSINGTTIQNLSLNTLNNLEVCIPTINEQEKIVNFLNKKVGEIDSLIVSKEALIAELEAYKKAVVYEYITGKKEVV